MLNTLFVLSAFLTAGAMGAPLNDDKTDTTKKAIEFESPVRIMANGELVSVPSPGYACPCLADIDNDGKKDLLVGQYSEGKINVFSGLGGDKFAAGAWLQADGSDAEIPGIW